MNEDFIEAHKVIAIVDDMIFTAKIRGTAEGAGVVVHFARSIAAVCEKANAEPTSLILVDLNAVCCDPFDLAKRLKSDQRLKTIPLLGFYSHVQTALQQQGEKAGYDRILPRSAFSKNLPKILVGEY